MNKKKIILIAVSIAVVAGIGFQLFGSSKAQHKVTYETAVIIRGEISESIIAAGTIKPVAEVEVGTQVSGIIDKIYTDYNSVVTKGQLMAEVDCVTLQSEVTPQRAAYNRAKAEYKYQQENYERNRGLHEKQLISDTSYEWSVYNYEKIKSNYESSQTSLAKAERNFSYATITFPTNGVVINRAMEERQAVTSSFETPTLFTITANLTQMQIVADVDEADIGGIEEGQRVSFTVDVYPNDMFEGAVTQIRLREDNSTNSGNSTSNTIITYEVVISTPNPDLKLKPCLTANVTIYMLDRRNIFSVSAHALRFTPERPLIGENDVVKDCESPHRLWTCEGNTLTTHPVTMGISNGINTEIISDIGEGAAIMTEATIGEMPEGGAPTDMQQAAGGEKGPFMPGPPGSNKEKSK